MDPISVSALVAVLTKISGGMTDEAGRQVWDSLTKMIRNVFRRRSASAEAMRRLDERPGDPDSITALARALVADAGQNPRAAVELHGWLERAERAVVREGTVSNTVSGTVYGNVIQVDGDVHGGINL